MKKLTSLLIFTFLFTNGLLAQDTILFGNLLYGGSAKNIVFRPSTNLLFTGWHGGGLIEYNPLNDSVINWDKRSNSILHSNYIWDYAYDADSSLWLTSYKNGVYKFDEADYQCYNSENSPLPEKAGLFYIEYDQNNELWIGTADSGLYIRHTDSSWSHYPPGEETILRGNKIFTIYEDNEGSIYIGTDIGVTIFDNSTWKYIDLSDYNGYSSRIQQIYKSTYDTLYVVSNDYCYIQKSINHHVITPEDFNGIGSFFHGITENNSRDIFISSSDGFIMIPHLGATKVYNKEITPGGEKVESLGGVFYDKYRDKLFFNNRFEMITFEDEEFKTPFCIGCDDLPSSNINAAFFDNRNRFWIASDKYFHMKEENIWTKYSGSGHGLKFVQTPAGELLYCTSEYVWVFKDSLWKKTSVSVWVENNGIYDITTGKDNFAYAATRIGIYKKNAYDSWFNIGVTDKTNAITCDKDGLVWFSIESKIGSYDGENITYYSVFNSDLPPSDEYHSICADSIGRLWLETDSSVYVHENDEWKCIIPSFQGWLINVFVDDYFNTWLLSGKNLYFMNQSDTIVFNYENAPFTFISFSGGTPGPENSFYVNSYSAITTVQYTVIEDVEEKPDNALKINSWVKVFPNPSDGWITFKVLENDGFPGLNKSIVEIRNLQGQTIFAFTFDTNSITLDAKSLKPGIYIFQVRQGDRQSRGKIVVQ